MRAGQRPDLAVRFVEFDERGDVNVRHAIAVGRAKNSARLQIFPRAPEPGAGHGIFAGVHTGDAPRLGGLAVKLDAVRAVMTKANRDVVCERGKIQEKIADVIPLVTEQQNKFVEAMGAVNFHDVPQDGAVANRRHRLGNHVTDFTEARATASA